MVITILPWQLNFLRREAKTCVHLMLQHSTQLTYCTVSFTKLVISISLTVTCFRRIPSSCVNLDIKLLSFRGLVPTSVISVVQGIEVSTGTEGHGMSKYTSTLIQGYHHFHYQVLVPASTPTVSMHFEPEKR